MAPLRHGHSRADRQPRSGGELQQRLHGQPVVSLPPVVAEHRRQVVDVDEHQVDVAVVVEVAPRRAAPDVLLEEVRPGLSRDVLERAVALVAHERVFLDVLVVRVAVRDEDVEPAVVVVVEHACRPSRRTGPAPARDRPARCGPRNPWRPCS